MHCLSFLKEQFTFLQYGLMDYGHKEIVKNHITEIVHIKRRPFMVPAHSQYFLQSKGTSVLVAMFGFSNNNGKVS